MAGPGAITVSSVTPTAPSQLNPTVASALSAIHSRIGQVDLVNFPALRAIAVANGVDFQYHLLDGAQYITGPRAPYTAPTVASTASFATATLTFSGQPSDGAAIRVWKNTDGSANGYIYFKSTLSLGIGQLQVKIGSTQDDTLNNLYKLMTNTGVEGTDYTHTAFLIFLPYANAKDYFNDLGEIQASASDTTANTVTFRAMTAGTHGNAYTSTEFVADANLAFGGTVFSGGANGTGTAPSAGTRDYAYAYVRKADQAVTALSHEATLDTLADFNVTADNLDAPASRDGIDIYRLFRTTDTGSEWYRTADDTADPITDEKDDDEIAGDGNDPFDNDIKRPYEAGYPTRYRFHTEHLGCLFGAGAYPNAKHSSGTVAVTNGSRTATLSGGVPKTLRIGRNLRVTADEDRYLIVDVDETTRELTLSTPYEGTTDASATYEITDDRNPFLIYYTEALLLNDWHEENVIDGVTSADARGVMGLRSIGGMLAALTRTGAWKVLGTPDQGFQVAPVAEGCGCYTNRGVVKIGDGLLAWIGPDGVQVWDGRGVPRSLSEPKPVETGELLGISGTIARINPIAADGIVGNYNPSLNVVRWAVPVDGSPWNNLVIQLNLQTETFTFTNCDAITAMETIVGPSGSYITLSGDMYGNLWQMDNGYSDGAYGFDCAQEITAYDAATNTFTVDGTPFPTSSGGLSGVPAVFIAADGTRQRATIAENTTSTATLVSPITAPAVGTQVILGAIFWRLKTSKFTNGAPNSRRTLSSVAFHFQKSTAGQVWCAAHYDDNDPLCATLLDSTIDYADLTAASGVKRFELIRGPGRTTQIELFALAPGFDVTCVALEATFREREEVPR